MYVRLTSGRKISGLFGNLRTIRIRAAYVPETFLAPRRGAGKEESASFRRKLLFEVTSGR